MNTEIAIDNLKCHGCANTIMNSIKKMRGVENVEVDVENSKVSNQHNTETAKSDLIDKLSSLGYPEQGTSTTFQKAKSYVSCAVGRMS